MVLFDSLKKLFKSNPKHKTFMSILSTSSHLMEKYKLYLEKYHITPQQFQVLTILATYPKDKLHVGFIKEKMIDKSSDISRMVSRLAEKGWVYSTSNKDKRKNLVALTEDGISKLEEIHLTLDSFLNETLVLPDEKLSDLNETLEHIRR